MNIENNIQKIKDKNHLNSVEIYIEQNDYDNDYIYALHA